MDSYKANILNNALMLAAALAMFYLLDAWWKIMGVVPLICVSYAFGLTNGRSDAAPLPSNPQNGGKDG